MTLKPPLFPCPHCGGVCAEYQQQNQPMRWTCNLCGRGGLIEVEAQEVQETVKPVHKHWSEVGREVHGLNFCPREPLNTTHRFSEAL